MDVTPTFRIDGETFFRIRPKHGDATLHAAMIGFYAEAARIGRMLVDLDGTDFNAADLVAVLAVEDLAEDLRVIVMDRDGGVEDRSLPGRTARNPNKEDDDR